MQEKSPEKSLKNPANPIPAGNFRFYVLQTLLLQTSPITVTQLRELLREQDLFFHPESLRTALAEIEQILPVYGLQRSTVRTGDSKCTAYFLANKTTTNNAG